MTLEYETPPTAVTGQGLSAADWNSKVRDSIEALANRPKVMVYRTASQAVGHASISNVVWQQEAYDSDNMWTAGVNPDRVTVPRTGLYLVTFCAQFAPHATGGRHLAIMKNGAGVAQWNSGGGAWYTGGTVVAIQPMVAGDYFQGMAYQSSGVALNLDIAYPINMVVAQIGL